MALCSDVEPPAAVWRIAALELAPGSTVNACRISTRLSKSMTCARSFGLSRSHEVGGGRLQRVELVLHAGAAVEQQRERDRLLAAVEEHEVLLDAVLEDREVGLLEVGDVAVGAVDRP